MVYFCYFLMLTVAFFVQETESSDISLYKMFVNDEQVGFNSILWVNRSLPVLIACRMTVANDNLVMKKIVDSRKYKLASAVTVNQSSYTFLNYTLTEHDKWSLVTTYRCVDKRKPYAPNYSQVTISFTLHFPSTPADTLPPHITNTPPLTFSSSQHHTTTPLTVAHTTEETHTVSPGIRGLNPLIYAVSVLILLGSLALVALLTCWIRVRRSYNRRHYQLTNNPQDYLDYISDNDLTPLASSELAASLEERPPSYSESEKMSPETASSRESQRQNGRRIIESVLRRSRILSSSRLRPSSSGRNTDGEPSERDTGPPTLTVPHTVAAVEPSASLTQFTTRSTSHNTPNQQATELTATEGNINDQNGEFPQTLSLSRTTTNIEESSDHNAAPGCSANGFMSSGIDYLISMDLNARNGNGTQLPSLEPIPQSESDHETPVGMLIDLT